VRGSGQRKSLAGRNLQGFLDLVALQGSDTKIPFLGRKDL
jgi:hypothetical protein